MTYKLDLHTHSQASPDGSLTLEDYRRALAGRRLDYIAITDHNRIDFALQAQAALGDGVIVGEEITAAEGEIIGLYLRQVVPAGLPLTETVERIRKQGGVVYAPHPFETVRKGLPVASLEAVAASIDIIEICNGRAVFQRRGSQAHAWARTHHVPGAASSDAHGRRGWGRTYSIVNDAPNRENLVRLLQTAQYATDTVGWRGLLYPKLNRLRGSRHA